MQENLSLESNQFKEMKEYVHNLEKGIGSKEVLERYIQGVIISGYHSKIEVFRSCCLYLSTSNICYEYGFDYPMMTTINDKNNFVVVINPVVLMKCVDGEQQILFILAHEVKHILYRHLIKYRNFFNDEVNQVFMNLAVDVEVNTLLEKEIKDCFLSGFYYQERDWRGRIIPKVGCVGIVTIREIIKDFDVNFYLEVIRSIRGFGQYSDDVLSIADKVYVKLNEACRFFLGKDINRIIYDSKIKGISFKQGVYDCAMTGNSRLFEIPQKRKEEAIEFCKNILSYLRFNRTSFIDMLENATEDKDCHREGFDGRCGKFKDAFEERKGRKTVDSVDVVDWYDVEDNLNSAEESWEETCVLLGIRTRGVGFGRRATEVDCSKSETKVPWEAVLRGRLNSYSRYYESTRKRFNRRQPDRLEISGRKRKRSINLILGIDESGSISNEEYRYFVEEVFKIIKEFDCSLHIYEFTGEVESYTYISNKKVNSFKEYKKKFSSSRFIGGTSFQSVFDAIDKNERVEKDSLLIMFTDGEGEQNVDFKSQKDRLWVIVGMNGYLSCQERKANIFPIARLK